MNGHQHHNTLKLCMKYMNQGLLIMNLAQEYNMDINFTIPFSQL